MALVQKGGAVALFPASKNAWFGSPHSHALGARDVVSRSFYILVALVYNVVGLI